MDIEKYKDKILKDIKFENDVVKVSFEDCKIIISDTGQFCCENRYLTFDGDDKEIESLIGSRLLSITTKDAPNVEENYGVHEIQFLEISTDKGFLTFASHNEHNGYYGGLSIEIREVEE